LQFVWLKVVDKYINENLIKHAALYQRDALASRRHYEELMKDFEMLKRLMADYGAGYIFVDDFKPNELQVLDPTDAPSMKQ
jgi:hypothetical protein